jgi:hypothetical protein
LNTRQTIKVYGISNTKADFLLFRNSLKLVITFSKPGQIEISFHSISGGLFAPHKMPEKNKRLGIPRPPGEIEVESGDFVDIELGPFNEALWNFKGHQVTPTAVVRFYLTEFIKNSAS